MKSWRTTLGGSLSATGALLFGMPIALSATKVTVPDQVFVWCVLGGVVLLAAGTFFSGLFARDNSVPSSAVPKAVENQEKVEQAKADTKFISKDNGPVGHPPL